jgi:hypothetical protein
MLLLLALGVVACRREERESLYDGELLSGVPVTATLGPGPGKLVVPVEAAAGPLHVAVSPPGRIETSLWQYGAAKPLARGDWSLDWRLGEAQKLYVVVRAEGPARLQVRIDYAEMLEPEDGGGAGDAGGAARSREVAEDGGR